MGDDGKALSGRRTYPTPWERIATPGMVFKYVGGGVVAEEAGEKVEVMKLLS